MELPDTLDDAETMVETLRAELAESSKMMDYHIKKVAEHEKRIRAIGVAASLVEKRVAELAAS